MQSFYFKGLSSKRGRNRERVWTFKFLKLYRPDLCKDIFLHSTLLILSGKGILSPLAMDKKKGFFSMAAIVWISFKDHRKKPHIHIVNWIYPLGENGFWWKEGERQRKESSKISIPLMLYLTWLTSFRAGEGQQLLGWKSGFENTAFLFHFLYWIRKDCSSSSSSKAKELM